MMSSVSPRETEVVAFNKGSWIILALLVVGGLWLALDGDLFWDEPGYLYVAKYVDGPDFFRGTFQPSVIDYFYLPKILHMMVVKGLVAVAGPGTGALAAIMLLYTLLIAASLVLSHAILRRLMPESRSLGLAIGLTALAPVILYMGFKTLPEAPALFFATLALYAFIRSLERSPAKWIAIAAISLACMALNRHSLAALISFFVITAFLIPPAGISRGILVNRAILTAVLSVALTLGLLAALGISLEHFLMAHAMFEKQEPVVFRIMSTVFELGPLWLFVPLAFFATDRRQALFMLTWFALATIPMATLFGHLESRYLIQNLVPFAGLVALVIDDIRGRKGPLARLQPVAASAPLVAGLAALLLASNWITLRLMPAEANIWQIRSMLARIEAEVGDRDYAILTPWITTDFYYLRFAYPDLPVFNVSDEPVTLMEPYAPVEELEDRFFRNRYVRSIEGLEELPETLVYLGYGETFMVANARKGLAMVPGIDATRVIPERDFIDHLATSWMWRHPRIGFELLAAEGHYRAYLVNRCELDAEDRPPGSAC